MIVQSPNDTTALSHGGQRFEPDASGRWDVPAELGAWLIHAHGWTEAAAAEAAPAVPDIAPAVEKPARKPRAKKAAQS